MKVSEGDNHMLISPFSVEEVKLAIESCESSKSLGPDGFNFSFFKTFWETYRDELLRFLGDFHKHGKLSMGSW